MRRHIYYTLQSLLHKQGSNAIKIVSLALGLLMSVFLFARIAFCLLYTSPSPRDISGARMPSSA